MSYTVKEKWIEENRAKAKRVKDQTRDIRPILYGKCPFCDKHVVIWTTSENLLTFDVCPWCNGKILWDEKILLGCEEPLTP